MEIKRKKITNEAIYAAEQKLIGEIRTFCDGKKAQFEELGYDLELVFGQKENEAEIRYKEYTADENKTFDSGYISHAVISIKRKKTEEERAEDEAAMEANRALLDAAETEEEVDQIQSDEELRVADDANKRLTAFTELMLVRTYKSFWVEWVSLGEGTHELENDLAEFYEKLKEKIANAE
jgi:hypothetical protein